MKKHLIFLFFFISLFLAHSQAYKISVVSDINADSLFLCSYSKEAHTYQTLQAVKFQKDIEFQGKEALEPGMYIIKKDTLILVEFFISDLKNQNFKITIKNQQIHFKESPENEANRVYIKKMQEFDSQIQKLDDEFNELKKGKLPNYMLQPFVDTIAIKAENIQKKKKDYQYSIIQLYQGTLFSSVVKSSMEIATPPKEYYNNKTTYFLYLAQHHFDHYVWGDNRLLNTPIPQNKFKFFSQVILQLEPEVATPIVIEYLNKSKISAQHYYSFFDYLELFFGSIISPYRDEYLYIKMLQDALTYPELEKGRRARYEKELEIIDRNLKGSIVPNFPLLMKDGDTTTLYDIQADYLILYFQNPDCPTCIELRQRMESMDHLKKTISEQKVKVLTIFFEEQENLWRNFLKTAANPAYLHGWNYDLTIFQNNLFDTRTIPMLILVDKDKRVIKKDLMSNEIELYMKLINP